MNENASVSQQMHEARTQTRAAAKSVSELARTLTLAGIGAVALARDEAQALMDRMIERGVLAEREARKRMEKLGERSKEQGDQAQSRLERQVEGVMARMNVPTKDDIASLNANVSILSAKIDTLLASQGPVEPGKGAAGQPLPPVEPLP